ALARGAGLDVDEIELRAPLCERNADKSAATVRHDDDSFLEQMSHPEAVHLLDAGPWKAAVAAEPAVVRERDRGMFDGGRIVGPGAADVGLRLRAARRVQHQTDVDEPTACANGASNRS